MESCGFLRSNNADFSIRQAHVFGRLSPDWLIKISPSSICWSVEIWCWEQEMFCDFPEKPAVDLWFRQAKRGGFRAIAPSCYTTSDTLSGTVYVEYSELTSGRLDLAWRAHPEMTLTGEFDTVFGTYTLETIATFQGIRVQDVGSMDLAEATKMLERALDLDELDLDGSRQERQLSDGRDYAEILFSPR